MICYHIIIIIIIIRYTEKVLFPCLHEKLAPCKYWLQVIPVQMKINDFLAQHENPEDPCLIERTLVYDDHTSSSAECDIKFMEAIREGVKSRQAFTDAVCLGFAAHYDCSLDKPISSLQQYLQSQHEKFYNDFWDMNCQWMMEEENNTEVIAPGNMIICYIMFEDQGVRKHVELKTGYLTYPNFSR